MPAVAALRRRHDAVALAVIAAAAATGGLAGGRAIAGSLQAAVLLASVLVGLPHGALDDLVARRRFAPRWGAGWVVPFLAGYAVLGGAMLLAWWIAPWLALGVFLAISVVHFGQRQGDRRAGQGWAGIVARGGLPVVMPAIAHPAALAVLLGGLAGGDGQRAAWLLGGPLAAAWAMCVAAAVLRGMAAQDRLELLVLGGSFVLLPPLVAFALYFAVLHAPRALLADLAAADPQPWHTLTQRLAHALPFSLAAVVLGVGLALAWHPASVQAGVVAATFRLLSALTVPHMWLAAGMGRRAGQV